MIKYIHSNVGTADDADDGQTVNVKFMNDDVLTIEIPSSREYIWVQYSHYDKGSLVPGDGRRVEL